MGTQARLIVDAARLGREGGALRGELSAEALDGAGDEFVAPVGGPAYDLRAQALGSELLVRGRLRQRLRCVCRRCAETFETEVEEPDFTRSFEINEARPFVDLTGEVREAIMLVFPAYPVCAESCRGLCPRCGKNLNAGPCGCRGETDGRWAGLDAPRRSGRAGGGVPHPGAGE